MNDCELLRKYAKSRCEASFSELVQRNIGLVFGAARRQVDGNRALAEEVTQTVFSDLARKAGAIAGREVLSGWLYTSTRFAAGKVLRTEQRRRVREQEAFAMQETLIEPVVDSNQTHEVQKVLDSAMHDLPEKDRNALLLRFFDKRPLAQVGQALGVSEDGARMRVERALEKLRKLLLKRGVVSSTSALAVVLAEPILTAAPVGLAASVAGAAMAGTASLSATPLLQFMGMTKIKTVAAAVVIAGVGMPAVLQHRANLELRVQNQELQAKTSALAGEINPLKQENQRLAALLAENARTADRSNEVFKLRDEVTRLKSEARAVPAARAGAELNDTLRSLGARAARLKDGLARMPERSIPELQLLTEKDWLNAVTHLDALDTEEQQRQALSVLRASAKSKASDQMKAALRKFAEANNGMLPTDLSELNPYFDGPFDPAVLQRYKLTRTGKLEAATRDHHLIVETAPPVDDEYDTTVKFDLYGTSSYSFSRIGKAIEDAAVAYAEANNGRIPRDPAQVIPFLQEPIDAARVQKALDKIPPHVTTLAQMKDKR